VPFIGLIKFFLTISTIFRKKNRENYNGKDMPNIQIGITSFLYKILTNIQIGITSFLYKISTHILRV